MVIVGTVIITTDKHKTMVLNLENGIISDINGNIMSRDIDLFEDIYICIEQFTKKNKIKKLRG